MTPAARTFGKKQRAVREVRRSSKQSVEDKQVHQVPALQCQLPVFVSGGAWDAQREVGARQRGAQRVQRAWLRSRVGQSQRGGGLSDRRGGLMFGLSAGYPPVSRS